MSPCTIGNLTIHRDQPPVVIAEIGASHDGSVEKAEALVRAIAQAGAKAVKFQTYSAEELVADANRITRWGPPGQEREERISDLFHRLSLPREAHRDLFQLARELGMEPFSTPFSEDGVDFLNDLDVPCFKIAASDVIHLPLLQHVARTGKPVLLSLGKCTLSEVDLAYETLINHGCQQLCLMHCVAQYPAPMDEMNLRVIPTLQQTYPEVPIGFSDHSLGITAPIAAIALGARLVEKHVTLDCQAAGPDHWFSLDMPALANLVESVADAYSALGHPRKRILPCEQNERSTSTRSLVLRTNVSAGHRIDPKDLKIVRPGNGIAPKYLDVVQGMTTSTNLDANTVLQWEMFK